MSISLSMSTISRISTGIPEGTTYTYATLIRDSITFAIFDLNQDLIICS